MIRPRRWRQGDLAAEALRNVTNRLGPAYLQALVAAALAALVALLLAWGDHDFTAALREERLAGRWVVVIQPAERGTDPLIDRRACEALASIDGVRRAGAVVDLGHDALTQVGPFVPVLGVSVELLPELAGGGVAMVAAPDEQVVSGFVRTARLAPAALHLLAPQPVPLGLDAALLVPIDPAVALVDACYVEVDPATRLPSASTTLLAGVRARARSLVAVPVLGDGSDPIAAYLGRPHRRLAIGSGVLGALLSALVVRVRRGEVSAYKLVGSTNVEVAVLLLLEQLLAVGAFAALGAGAIVVARSSLVLAAADVVTVTTAALTWVLTFAVLAVGEVRRNPLRDLDR